MPGFDFHWVSAEPGRLALWHRPKLRAIPYLGKAGCDRVATLLSEREGARDIGLAVERAGLAWSWIPLPGGRAPEGAVDRRAREGIERLSERLDAGDSILIHCSAGMHRTGMIAYALLRRRGLGEEAALARIEALRPLTRSALAPEHLRWGDQERSEPGGKPMTSRETGSGALSAALLEQIARAIHARYRKNQKGRKPETDAAMRPWEELPDSLQGSNRDQAADIGTKLRAIGCGIAPAEGTRVVVTFTPAEIERLAVLEYERWVAERRASGWTAGPVRDVERKITPHLVPYEQLPEEIREYDREAVRAIPEVLAEAGLVLYRL